MEAIRIGRIVDVDDGAVINRRQSGIVAVRGVDARRVRGDGVALVGAVSRFARGNANEVRCVDQKANSGAQPIECGCGRGYSVVFVVVREREWSVVDRV